MAARGCMPRAFQGAGGTCRCDGPRIRRAAHGRRHSRDSRDNPKGSLMVVGYDVPKELEDANGALKTFGVDLQIANDVDADIIHAHTWYACLAGYLAKMLHDTPLVITAHSLEPFRPWKREQLGGGYNLSSWAEKDAYEHADRVIAVSAGMREDILTAYPNLDPDKVVVVHNGITMSQFETPADDDPGWKVFERYNIDRNKPTLLFVGRITRQKGLPYLLQALHFVDPTSRSFCAPALPTRRKSWKRSRPPSPSSTRNVATSSGSRRCCRSRTQRTRTWLRRIHLPIHLRAARHRESWKPWHAVCRWSPLRPVAFRKSSSTARPDIWCRSTNCMTALAPNQP